MAQIGKDYVNKITHKSQKKKSKVPAKSYLLTEEEQLLQLAQLIIDIHFDQQYEKENSQQSNSRSA
jgi:hypothetical protein